MGYFESKQMIAMIFIVQRNNHFIWGKKKKKNIWESNMLLISSCWQVCVGNWVFIFPIQEKKDNSK